MEGPWLDDTLLPYVRIIKLKRGASRVLRLILFLGVAVPTISDVTGAVTHGQSITITGTGFGTKAVVAPVAWDDASGPDGNSALLDMWDFMSPNSSITESNRIARRVPHRGVSPPHGRVGRYIAGAHNIEDFGTNGYNGDKGGNVFVAQEFPFTPGMSMYASCYMRFDPAWHWAGTAPPDNCKMFTWRMSPGPIVGGTGITMNFGGGLHPPSLDVAGQDLNKIVKWQCYNSTGDPDVLDGSSFYSGIGDAHNLILNGWAKYEVILKAGTAAADGAFLRIFENGRQVFGRAQGTIDTNDPPNRFFVFGEFARPYANPNNWRYLTDCYFDLTHQRVILGNAATLNSSSTIRELQIPTAWSDTSITVTVNRGVFADDDPVYVFVVDAANVASDGFLIEADPVSEPPVITSATSVFVTVNDTDPYQIVATNAPTSFGASPLPSGRSVSTSTGEITGIYDTFGVTQTVVSATNAFGTDQETVNFDVSQAAVSGIEDPVNIGIASNRTGTTLQVTVQQSVPVGNTIFVQVSTIGGTTTTGLPTCRDNVNGPNYIRDVFKTNTNGTRKTALFRFSNNAELPVGSVITVTISDSIAEPKAMTAWWVRGLNTFEPLDVINSNFSDTATTTPNSGPITTT